MGADSGEAAFAFLASTEGPFDDPADFFQLPPALAVRPSNVPSSPNPTRPLIPELLNLAPRISLFRPRRAVAAHPPDVCADSPP